MAADKPITHTWRRRETPPPEPAAPAGRITVDIPPGDPPPADVLAEQIRAALRGWPVVVLRAIGSVNGKPQPGPYPGQWLRGQIGEIVDRTLSRDAGQALLGAHTPGRVVGGAWAPIALRTSPLGDERLKARSDVRIELVLTGRATLASGELIRALLKPAGGLADEEGFVRWSAIKRLECDADGDPRWRAAVPGVAAAPIPIERIAEPNVRTRRVMVTFNSPAAIARRDELGDPWPDLAVLVDRIGRTMSTLLKRSKHPGPHLPDDDLLRVAARGTMVQNHTRVVQIPGHLVGAEPPRFVRDAPPPDDGVPSLTGSVTFRGDFTALRPLLAAASWIGMGPGRQNGLGEIAVR